MKTLPPGKLNNVPELIREDLKLCLQFTPELRPDAAQLLLIKYFDDPGAKVLASLESLRLIEGSEKVTFFKTLPTTYSSFPKRILTRRVLPALADEMRLHPQAVPLVLPSVLQAAELLDQREFAKFALPALEPVLQLEKAYQAWHLILQKTELILSKLSLEDSRRLLVSMACNALESDSATLHETSAQVLHKLTPLIDAEIMRKRIVPRLLTLATDINVLSVRVNALLCIGRLLDNLEKWQVTEQILPALAKIQSRDPAILMAILGVFRLSFNCAKLSGLGKDVCAKVCLPFLVTSCVEQALNARQFEAFMSLIRDMINKVETEQRRRLEQAPAPVSADDSVIGNSNHTAGNKIGSSDNLASLAPTSAKPATEKKGGLSLEEKRRLVAEQEKTMQLRQQAPLEPVNTTAKTAAPLSLSNSSSILDSLATMTSTTKSSSLSLANPSFNVMQSPPSTTFGNMMMPQTFSTLSSPPQSSFQQKPTGASGDPFASLNVFGKQETPRGPTGPARLPSSGMVTQQPQQGWPSGISPIRPPPPPPQPNLNVMKSQNSMIIPPPPAPAPQTFVKAPSMGTSVNWNQSSVLDASLNSAVNQSRSSGNQQKPKAKDELADLLG